MSDKPPFFHYPGSAFSDSYRPVVAEQLIALRSRAVAARVASDKRQAQRASADEFQRHLGAGTIPGMGRK